MIQIDLVCKLPKYVLRYVELSQHWFVSLQGKLKTEEKDGDDWWEDDGEGAGEALEDVVRVLDDDGHK